MKPAPTMIDALYRASFKSEPVMGFLSNAALRERLVGARRLMLDARMSDFLGELATRAFIIKAKSSKHGSALMSRQVDALRVSARAPHRVTWIEYDLRATLARTNELLGKPFDPKEVPEREGWLIEQHPQLETAFRLHLFTTDSKMEEVFGFDAWAFPVTYTWTVNEEQPPWRSLLPDGSTSDSTIATGVIGYDTPTVSIAQSELMKDVQRYKKNQVADLIKEWVGTLRRVWALLATFNDVPMTINETKATKGFVAKGSYRRFLNHSTLTINLPQKVQTRITRDLIALVRRRAHQVRGHWRDDRFNPPSKRCVHLWTAEQRCSLCGGHRLWIREHERGDASLGFVTHDYNLRHEGSKP